MKRWIFRMWNRWGGWGCYLYEESEETEESEDSEEWLIMSWLANTEVAVENGPGGMAEWSKALDSKSSNPQKGFEGSNPSPTAIRLRG